MNEPNLSLVLECWPDDLIAKQIEKYEKAIKEESIINEKLKELCVSQSGEELFLGELFSAYQFQGKVDSIDESNYAKIPQKKNKSPQPKVSPQSQTPQKQQPTPVSSRSAKRKVTTTVPSVILDDNDDDDDADNDDDDDDDDDVPLSKRSVTTKKDKDYVPSHVPKKLSKSSPTAQVSTKDKKSKTNSKGLEVDNEKNKVVFRPSEITSIGGLTVGAIKDDSKVCPDSKENLQGKTFPSLVVVAKPHINVKEQLNVEKTALDSKVRVVLMLTPAKFTEWLIQQGLLKSEQKCVIHPNNELKLGVYSDASKFPYSGGYVWISECCPTRFISVFNKSIFEGSPHPPSCILKLIYHWACQTNIQNVVQWVKVDNLYIKGVYTWLRAMCTLALNKHLKPIGGAGKYVEVGVISLGTTAQDGQQRQVKVEVLGVLDPVEKIVRLRAVDPFTEADRNYRKRFAKILEPLNEWVLKDSIITTDLTIDKTTLYSMGFKNVLQVAPTDEIAKYSNKLIMDYLRRIVPRMFQNTLSLLSRQMIQQFLDELVWREQFGTYALEAFDNITTHLAEQTRIDTKETLTQHLFQVATNPFKNWKNTESNPPLTPRDPRKSKKSTGKDINTLMAKATKISSTHHISHPTTKQSPPAIQQTSPKQQNIKPAKKTEQKSNSVELSSSRTSEKVETRGLEEIYYGILEANENVSYNIKNIDNLNVSCPSCFQKFDSNIQLQHDILSHVDIETNREDYKYQCLFCLEKLPSERNLKRHEAIMHPSDTKMQNSPSYNCLICHTRLNTIQMLSTHLQKTHVPLEIPYNCYACGYRCSSHFNIIQHFYERHINNNMLQCPLCLAIFWIYSNGKVLENNISQYFLHVQKHFIKSSNKKCTKCVLTFTTKGELKYHLLKEHLSFKDCKQITRLIESTMSIPVPKFKAQNVKSLITYKTLEEYPSLQLNLSGGSLCLECDRDLDEGIHINAFYKCPKCEYKTCCLRAVLDHTSICPKSSNIEYIPIKLDNEYHCVCGFSNSEGNSMARHLTTCEHKSAYPSVESVQENTVKRNMLDMLGLVRREGEDELSNNEATQNNYQIQEKNEEQLEKKEQEKEGRGQQKDEEEEEGEEKGEEEDNQQKEVEEYQPKEVEENHDFDESQTQLEEHENKEDKKEENLEEELDQMYQIEDY